MATQCAKHVSFLTEKGLRVICEGLPGGYGVSTVKTYCLGFAPHVQQSRLFHCSHGTGLRTKTHPQEKDESAIPSSQEPEYIPKRKAKNPMVKIGYAWIIGLPSGIIGFLLAKRQVDKNRQKQLKIRQRMKKSNEGPYESERYSTQTKSQ